MCIRDRLRLSGRGRDRVPERQPDQCQTHPPGRRGRVHTGGLSAGVFKKHPGNVCGAGRPCPVHQKPVPAPAGGGVFRGGQGLCEGILFSFRGQERAPRICGRAPGAHAERDEALRCV